MGSRRSPICFSIGAADPYATPAMRPPFRSSTVCDFSTSFNCPEVNETATSSELRTAPRCSKYPTPFLYRTTRFTGSRSESTRKRSQTYRHFDSYFPLLRGQPLLRRDGRRSRKSGFELIYVVIRDI